MNLFALALLLMSVFGPSAPAWSADTPAAVSPMTPELMDKMRHLVAAEGENSDAPPALVVYVFSDFGNFFSLNQFAVPTSVPILYA